MNKILNIFKASSANGLIDWNPHTAIGKDLDRLGKVNGLTRDFDTWITESDTDFRKRVLFVIKIKLDKVGVDIDNLFIN